MGDVKIAEPETTDIESQTNEVFISNKSQANAVFIISESQANILFMNNESQTNAVFINNESQANVLFMNNESQTNAVFINNDIYDVPLKSSASDSESLSPKTLKFDSITADLNPIDSGSKINGAEFRPITPSPDGETVNFSSSSEKTNSSEILSYCETPKECTFNPFAPASEEFALAPKKKIPREFKIPTRRKLNFDNCCSSMEVKEESCTNDEDEDILESICTSFLELIIKNQCNEKCDSSDDNSDVFRTPTLTPLLTGIAESCPDAPLRPGSKSRIPKSDQGICRKLEFDSCLI